MKHHFLLLFLTVFAVHSSYSQSSCSTYYPLVDGANFQYTIYNKKGEENGKTNYKVTNVQSSGDNVKATMMMELVNKRDKIYTSDYDIVCNGGIVKIDFKSLMNEQMLNQIGNLETEISGTDVELPNDLSVGQELPDANVSVKMKMGGGINMNSNIDIINRKVEKQEKVTTPAGTFDCYVVYSENKTKMITTKQRTWLAEGIGMVKQESYNKKGNLITSMVLTEFNK